jgi:hypothetical protein
VLKACIVKKFTYASSCIAFNNGNGNFSVQKLPLTAQLSSINAIRCTDVNNDGFVDLVVAGNDFGFLPQFSRLDASFGNVLLNDGKGKFTCLNSVTSGLYVKGVTRDIAEIKMKAGRLLLFLENNDYPVLYKITKDVTEKKLTKK